MKKITLILTLALACFGVTTMSAQVETVSEIGAEVTDATTLSADKSYVIQAVEYHKAQTAESVSEGKDVTDGTQYLLWPGTSTKQGQSNTRRVNLGNPTAETKNVLGKRTGSYYLTKIVPVGDGSFNISIGGKWFGNHTFSEGSYDWGLTLVNEDQKGTYNLSAYSNGFKVSCAQTNGIWLNYNEGDPGVWAATDESRAMVVKIYEASTTSIAPLTKKASRITSATQLKEGFKYVVRNIGVANRRGYMFAENGALRVTYGDEYWNTNVELLGNDCVFTIKGDATTGFAFVDENSNEYYTGSKLVKKPGEADGVWNIKTTGSYLNLNFGNIVEWNSEGDANGKWEIYPVEVDSEEATVTFVLKNGAGVELARKEVTGSIIPGLVAPTPDFEMQAGSEYYTFNYDTEAAAKDGAVVDVTFTENLPFKVSESFENAYWYGMTIHGNKVIYNNGEASSIVLNKTTQDLLDDNNLWCFVGDAYNGYKIYNKAAGATKILSSSTTMSGTEGGGTYPILTEESSITDESLNNKYWAVTKGNGTNGFFLGQKDFPGNRLNDRSINNVNYLAYWTGGADDGSTFTVERANIFNPNTDAVYRITFDRQTSVLGAYPYRTILNSSNSVAFEGGVCADANGDILDTPETYRYASTKQSTQEAGTLMQFVATDAQGKYQIRCLNACDGTNDFRLGSVKNSKLAITKYPDGYGTYVINNPSDGVYLIIDPSVTTDYKYLNCHYTGSNVNQHIGLWERLNSGRTDIDPGNKILIEEVTSLTQDISAAGWASATYPVAVTIPAGMKAYNATSVEGGVVKLEEMTGVIPARTPVFLEAKQGEYPMVFAAEEGTAPASSVLTGTLVERRDVTANSYYALGLDSSNEVALMKANVTGMPANKAVILADKVTSGIYASLKLEIGGETTGIDGVNRIDTENTQYFDLKGRRVMFPTNGIFVTNTGKKVFIK